LTVDIEDDPDLLEEMLNDMYSAPKIYQPTNYWKNYERILVPELRKKGLKDFRRRKNSLLTTFGASDLDPINGLLLSRTKFFPIRKGRLLRRILRFFFRFNSFEKIVKEGAANYHGMDLDSLKKLFYKSAEMYGKHNNAKPISDLKISTIGSPADLIKINNNIYTMSMLRYYIFYACCCKYVNFNSIESIMELGCGSGKQIEVIKKLHPKICFYLFDIPPQLYVCEQYLKAVFPNSVIGYRETKKYEDNT